MGQETWWQRSWKRTKCLLHLSLSWQVQPSGSSDEGEDCSKEDLALEKEDRVRDQAGRTNPGMKRELVNVILRPLSTLKMVGEIFVFILFPGLGFWRSSSAVIIIKCLDLWICNDKNNFQEWLFFMPCHRAGCNPQGDAKKDPSLCKANLGRNTARRGSRFFLFFALYIQQPNSALRFLSKAWGFSGLFPRYCPYKKHCCVFLTLTRYLVSLWKRRIKCSVVPAGHYSLAGGRWTVQCLLPEFLLICCCFSKFCLLVKAFLMQG